MEGKRCRPALGRNAGRVKVDRVTQIHSEPPHGLSRCRSSSADRRILSSSPLTSASPTERRRDQVLADLLPNPSGLPFQVSKYGLPSGWTAIPGENALTPAVAGFRYV
jgi:hypothetical protein